MSLKLPVVPVDTEMLVKMKSQDGKTERFMLTPLWKDYFIKQAALLEALRVKNGL